MLKVKPRNRRIISRILGAVFGLLSTATLAWPLPNALKTILEKSTMKAMPEAKHFFEGDMLQVAQAIDAADAQRTYTLAKALKAERLNAFGNEGLTLLKYAGYKAVPETPQALLVVTTLIKAGADPLLKSKESSNSGSILSVAALRARSAAGSAFLKAVLDGGVDPNTSESHGSTKPYLFRFASQDTPDSLKLMVERGADVNARDVLGETALFPAIRTFALDEVNYLLDHKADPLVVDKQGVSFAWYVYDKVLKQKDDPFKRYPKILALQERLIRAGMPWPPLSPKEMRKQLGIPEVEW